MYSTKPLSLFLLAAENNGTAGIHIEQSLHPPEGPFSGHLLIQEDSDGDLSSSCWGICRDTSVRGPQFPHNKSLRPLSANIYYVVTVYGKHPGLVCTCSRVEEEGTCCFCCRYVKDKNSSPYDPNNIYQHIQVIPKGKHCMYFTGKSVASDGYPRYFYAGKGAQLPPLDFPVSQKCSSSVIVGVWYCPFIFIKEKGGLENPKQQLKESVYYKMSLEQQWEEIHSCRGHGNETVTVNTTVRREEGLLMGSEPTTGRRDDANSMMWFETKEKKSVQGGLTGIGLSIAIMEKMRWDQDTEAIRVDKDEIVERVFHCGNGGEWTFALYILVERYVIRRMNGGLIFTYTFRHSHQFREKWA
ncbi:hypothetical protein AMTRI_Chr10g230840 [Amborella trichopoda]